MLRLLGVFALAAAVLAGCARTNVVTDYDPTVDFATYQSYRWLEETSGGDAHLSPLMKERVRDAVTNQLRRYRFREADRDEQPDFRVRYYVTEGTERHGSPARASVGLGRRSGNIGIGVGTSIPLGQPRTTRHLNIIIDLLDGETQRLSWRGQQSFPLKSEDVEAITEEVNKRVAEIWEAFPPSR